MMQVAPAETDAIGRAIADRLRHVSTIPTRELSVLAWQIVGEIAFLADPERLPAGWQLTAADRIRRVLGEHRGILQLAAGRSAPSSAPGFDAMVTAVAERLASLN
ncbi:hypothetical protein [Prescottella agglutinans]|uniref:tRNA G37 N-methylase Trm5 n=1 Tax=Prescottella agglutinans TaxID=1644129 RepID=A0ABT6MJN4_9NOCA|nr:hypothetical protein [Prescottella agglutinans]MDH6284016.1 tRNA G37 N-methylase Trm5 [Prescottella agglutinans]